MLEVRNTKTMGRGVFATTDITGSTVVHLAEIIKVKDSEINKCLPLAIYAYGFNNSYAAICLGLGSLFNHSDEPNIVPNFVKVDGRYMIEFTSLRNIEKDEQLFFDYGEDYAYRHLLKMKK